MFFRAAALLSLATIPCLAANSNPTLPLAFEDRGGTWVCRGSDYSLRIAPSGEQLNLGSSVVVLRMIHGHLNPLITGTGKLIGKANYFHGGDLRESFTLYSSVRVHDSYPGVDVIFRGGQDHLEYDFEIAGGRDPGVISLAFEGAESIQVDQRGDLILRTGGKEIRQPKPVAWQITNGRKEFVTVSYRIDASRRVSFQIGRHDPNNSLVVDPEVVFENVFGGSGDTSAAAIALDPDGNIYTAGQTNSPDFLTQNPIQSKKHGAYQTAFVTKWSPDGTQLLYSTYLGGSVSDAATGLAVDSSGNAYIEGITSSPDFPVTTSAFQQKLAGLSNAFIAELAPDGSRLIYSTYLGGGSEQVGGIAVDVGGEVMVTGQTNSANFPVTSNAVQTALVPGCTLNQGLPLVGVPSGGSAFITKIASDGGSLIFSTLFGGTCGTVGQAVAAKPDGEAWIVGETAAPDLPITASALQPQFGGGYVDGFIARFSADGGLAYASYLGGKGFDAIDGIALDGNENVYLGGVSDGLSQPASAGAFQSDVYLRCIILGIGPVQFIDEAVAFVAKLNPDASAITKLTYLGGGCAGGMKVAVDATGAPSFAGSSGNFPTVSPFQIAAGGGVLGKLTPDFTQLTFSTYFDAVNGLALDSNGIGYIAGETLPAGSNTENAYVARIDPTPPAVSLDQVLLSGIGPNGNDLIIAPGAVVRLLGKNLGPAAATPGIVNANGFVATSVVGVQVNFGVIAAPLLSMSASEIDCVVPFETAGPTTTISVQYNNLQSNSVKMSVAGMAVQVLGVFNEDFTVNASSNPASAGSVMSMYIASVGQTVPPSVDGQVNRAPFAAFGTAICVIDQTLGQDLPVTAIEAAPGAVAGVLQVNFFAPPQTSMLTIVAGAESSASANSFNVSVQ
jgi:uncharacterized protein (TIGR03437 family)